MGQQAFTTAGASQTFTVPVAVKLITLLEITGGGGGGGSGSDGAGGGAAGYVTKANISCSPGDTFSFDIGAAGSAESSGGNTVFNTPSSNYFIGYGGGGATGTTAGSGGTTGGSGTPTTALTGGGGGNGCSTNCDTCNSCNSYCCAYDSQMNCLSTCYSCSGTSNSSCSAHGAGGYGWDSPSTGGGSGSCSNNSNDNCGYCTGTSCSDAGTCCGSGAGGDGNGGTATDGGVRFTWTDGYIDVTTEPTTTVVNATISSIQVTAKYWDGTTASTYTGAITVSIDTIPSPPGATLGGTTSVNAVAGVATFSNLTIDTVGNGYELLFHSADIAGGYDVDTTPFNITAVSVTEPLDRVRHIGDQLAPRMGNLRPRHKKG